MDRLGIVMIVRNGAATIEACLESAIAAGATVATIIDTGSTDGTRALVRKACRGIDLRLVPRHRFRDFGSSRSRAFDLARGSAEWLLALDADMTVEWAAGWEPGDVDAYSIELSADRSFSYRLPLLLRGDRTWVSIGRVHEYTALADGTLGRREPTDAVRIRQPGAHAWTPAKGRWHLELLEGDETPRGRFYRAKTLEELGEPEARGAWLLAAASGGSPEERYYARWRAALLAPDWPTRATELLAAWESRPIRLEALHDLVAELNQRDEHLAAWTLSNVTPAPCGDDLFVHRWVWDYGLLFQRQIAAWWTGSPVFTEITARLLELQLPDHIRSAVERNASLRAA